MKSFYLLVLLITLGSINAQRPDYEEESYPEPDYVGDLDNISLDPVGPEFEYGDPVEDPGAPPQNPLGGGTYATPPPIIFEPGLNSFFFYLFII